MPVGRQLSVVVPGTKLAIHFASVLKALLDVEFRQAQVLQLKPKLALRTPQARIQAGLDEGCIVGRESEPFPLGRSYTDDKKAIIGHLVTSIIATTHRPRQAVRESLTRTQQASRPVVTWEGRVRRPGEAAGDGQVVTTAV